MKKALKVSFNILKWTLIAVLLLVLIFNLCVLVVRLTTGDSMPSVFGMSFAVVRSGSMSGSIEIGDMVIVKETDNYSVGDVITFKSGASYTTHRIMEINSDGFVTKGDANNTTDGEPVQTAQIKGKVIGVVPSVGNAVDFVRTPLGMALMLAVVVLLLSLSKIVDGIRDYLVRKNENAIVGGQENA